MRTVSALTVSPSMLCAGRGVLDLIPLNFPLGCGPGSDPPQFPPWVWAWIWSPSISPLGVDLDLIPLNFTLGCGPGGRGGLLLGASCSGRSAPGGSAPGRVCSGGWGVVSQHALRQTPPPWTESQTPVKTLPCPNFVAGGKDGCQRQPHRFHVSQQPPPPPPPGRWIRYC